MDYAFFQEYWWLLVSVLGALLVFLLFVQGGQSLFFSIGKEQLDRKLLVNSIGRKWEFTFTTLVVFGGGFFASFPLFYSTSFGGAFLLLFLILTWYAYKRNEKLASTRWLLWASIILTPLAWVASEAGWVVAEVGRQPWTIQNLLPVHAAISKIEASSVMITFALFFLLFTIMLVAEINIMRKAIKQGPDQH